MLCTHALCCSKTERVYKQISNLNEFVNNRMENAQRFSTIGSSRMSSTQSLKFYPPAPRICFQRGHSSKRKRTVACRAIASGSIRSNRHIVQRGDTLYKIATKHDLEVTDLLKANSLRYNSELRDGMELVIPRGRLFFQSIFTSKSSSSSSPSASSPTSTSISAPAPREVGSFPRGHIQYSVLGLLSVAAFSLGVVAAYWFLKRVNNLPIFGGFGLGGSEEGRMSSSSSSSSGVSEGGGGVMQRSTTTSSGGVGRVEAVRGRGAKKTRGVLYQQEARANKGGGRRILVDGGNRGEKAAQLLNMAQETYYVGTEEAFQLAHQDCLRALEIAADVNDNNLEMQAYGVLSEVCELEQDYTGAVDYATRSLSLATKLGNHELAMLANLAKGNALGRLGDVEAAIGHQRAAVEIAIELRDNHTEGRCYGALGLSYHALGHPHIATEYMEKSQDIFLRIGDLESLAVAYSHTGETCHALGDQKAGKMYQMKALELAQRIGNKDVEESVLRSLEFREEDFQSPPSSVVEQHAGRT